jgi:transposase-like protein
MKGNMGTKTRRKHYGSEMKAKVAVAAIRGDETANEIASAWGIHPMQVSKWKAQLLKAAADVFANGRARESEEELIENLYRQIGQQKVELDWLKKKSGLL